MDLNYDNLFENDYNVLPSVQISIYLSIYLLVPTRADYMQMIARRAIFVAHLLNFPFDLLFIWANSNDSSKTIRSGWS